MGRRNTAARRHTPAFKCEAVQTMQARLAAGVTLQRVSEELDVTSQLLRAWEKAIAGAPAGTRPEEIFPGKGHPRVFRDAPTADPVPSETPEAELRRLRRENERLRMERDFLKKATAFFARESR
jgi:transposase